MRAAESESGPELESVGSTVLAGVGVGAGVGKIWPTLTPARSRRPHPATEYDFGRTIMHSPENIARIFVWGLQTWKLCNAKTVNVALTTLTHMAQFLNFEQLLTDMCWDSKKRSVTLGDLGFDIFNFPRNLGDTRSYPGNVTAGSGGFWISGWKITAEPCGFWTLHTKIVTWFWGSWMLFNDNFMDLAEP